MTLCIVCITAVFLAGCSEGGTEVTREMIAEANVDIGDTKMPDYKNWSMDNTESGVRFIELKKGEGPRPNTGDETRVHYNLWLTNGQLVDSSMIGRGTPFDFPVGTGRVIAGWDEIVLLMNVGSRFLVEIPPKLGYGNREIGPIPKNSKLVFSIDLIRVK